MKDEITKEELEKIGRFTRRQMSADEIYTFPIVLCDNEIDRDKEKFTTEALSKIAELFVGKTGIFDHCMSSKDQTARIYSAQVETDPERITADGEIYTCVRAMAYMVRTEKNKELIAEIDAGIKKETSVSCSVKTVKCSVCGKDIKAEGCEHIKGKVYDGKQCFYLLCDPEDAYEWSFVAVPAQKNAGVTKSFDIAEKSETAEALYRAEIKSAIIKNGAEILPSMDGENLSRICDCLPLMELKNMRDALSNEVSKKLPLVSQLAVSRAKEEADNNDYII